MIQLLIQFTIFLICFGVALNFQGCANRPFVGKAPSTAIPIDHPDLQASSSATQGLKLIDVKAVQSTLENIYLSDNLTQQDRSDFDYIFNYEIMTQQHTFGHPCDPATYGTYAECNSNIANVYNNMSQPSSTIRQASRIQACRRLSAHRGIFEGVLRKIGVENTAPSPASLTLMLQLFYPELDENSAALEALSYISIQMERTGESSYHQWQVILNTLCESPYWELL